MMDPMKWLIAALAIIALLVSGYAVYQTKRIEAAIKPHVRLIAAATL
jgi:outer membrane lipoprotein-sorting protein